MLSSTGRTRRAAASMAGCLYAVTPGAVGVAVFGASPARANLTIVTNYSYTDTFDFPGSTSIASSPNAGQVEQTLNYDISTLESYLSNNITVDINFVNASSGLGESATQVNTIPYSQYLSDLKTKQTPSAADTTALATLPTQTNNPANGNSQIDLTAALLRALEGGSPGSTPDSTIGLNLSSTNTGRNNGSTGYDLQSTAAHEMDEALGIGGAGSELNSGSTTGPVGTLDLFRYSGSGARSYTTSANASSYFSINGGVTDLVHFNQNGLADDSDFGDWGDGAVPADGEPNRPPQVQDAYAGSADQPNLGANELTALDVVGWNLTAAGLAVENGTAVPEPTMWGVLACSTAALLVRRRRALS